MASTEVEMKSRNGELKHLEFVRVIALNALFCLSSLYEYAKQNSGPLKPMVGTVENAVSAVVGPVYQKVKAFPDDLLLLLDQKADEAMVEFNKHAPSLVKNIVGKALSIADNSLEVADNYFRVARGSGLQGVIRYSRLLLKNFIINQAAATWFAVSEIPLFHAVAYKALFTAAHWTDKYNKLVVDMIAKGYTIFSHFPLLPIEEFAKAYRRAEVLGTKKEDTATVSESETEND